MPHHSLRLDGIVKRFGDFTALKGVSLDIPKGEFVCFLGPSGCGKTTLLRIVAGLDRQDSGRVELDGRDVSRLPPAARDYGIVFQSYALFPNLTVRRNIAYGLKLKRDAERARVDELLHLVGLPDVGDKYPAQLSGGQQQRIALARALAPAPGLLLLDEPLSALDAQTRELLMEDFLDLWRRERTTAVYVTHNLDEALRLADRVAVLSRRPGRLREMVEIAEPRDARHTPTAQLHLSEVRDRLWHLIRAEAQLADREVSDA